MQDMQGVRDAILVAFEAMQKLRLTLVEAGLRGDAARMALNDAGFDLLTASTDATGVAEFVNLTKEWMDKCGTGVGPLWWPRQVIGHTHPWLHENSPGQQPGEHTFPPNMDTTGPPAPVCVCV